MVVEAIVEEDMVAEDTDVQPITVVVVVLVVAVEGENEDIMD